MDIRLGALAPSLVEQLDGLGIPADKLEAINNDAHAITRLKVRGLLTERESESARKRLIKQITKAAEEAA
jgi:hypothetical protein